MSILTSPDFNVIDRRARLHHDHRGDASSPLAPLPFSTKTCTPPRFTRCAKHLDHPTHTDCVAIISVLVTTDFELKVGVIG